MAVDNNKQAELMGAISFSTTNIEDALNKAYQLAFGRDVDPEGLTYWSEAISSGNLSEDNLIEALLAGAEAYQENPDYPENVALNSADKVVTTNKKSVAEKIVNENIDNAAFAQKALAAVNTDANTVNIVNALVDMGNGDAASLAQATATLTAIKELLDANKGNAEASAAIIEKVKTLVEAVATKNAIGEVTDIGTSLSAITATVIAAKTDTTFLDDETLADSISTDPTTVKESASAIIPDDTAPAPEPTPTLEPAPAPSSGGAPAVPSFVLATDTGSITDDGITNNPTVNVTGLEVGAIWEYSTNAGTNWAVGINTSFDLLEAVYTIGDIQVRQTNLAGNTSEVATNAAVIVVDKTAPALSSSTPMDDAMGVTVGENIVLTFNENVAAGTGNIVIKQASDDATVATISVHDAQVTFNGSTGVTINPAADLDGGTQYYLLIEAGAITDAVGNAYAGISETTVLSFTTVPTFSVVQGTGDDADKWFVGTENGNVTFSLIGLGDELKFVFTPTTGTAVEFLANDTSPGDQLIVDTITLTGTATHLSGIPIVGNGTVAITELEANPSANLGNITASTVTAAVTTTTATPVTLAGNFGKASVSLTGDGAGILFIGDTATMGTATFNVANGVILSNAGNDKLSGVTITGDGGVELGITASTDASHIASSLYVIGLVRGASANISANEHIGNVDSFIVESDQTLTAALAQVSGKAITGDGTVNVLTSTLNESTDVSGITANLTFNDSRSVVVNTPAVLTMNALQADKFEVNGDGELHVLGTSAVEVDLSALSIDLKLQAVLGDEDDALTLDSAQLAAGRTDVLINLSQGLNTLRIVGVSDAAAADLLSFNTGSFTGVDTLAFTDQLVTNGGDINDADINLAGIAPSLVVFESLVQSSQADDVRFHNEPSRFEVSFQGELDDTSGNGNGIAFSSNITDLTLNFAALVGKTSAINLTGNRLTNLTLNADANVKINNIRTSDSLSASERNILVLNTSGDGAISDAPGAIWIEDHLNGLVLNNTGAGERQFELVSVGDLKAAPGEGQAAGEGVEVTGNGTGIVTLVSTPTTWHNMRVDGSTYLNGTVKLDMLGSDGMVDAQHFSGIEEFNVRIGGNSSLCNLAEGTAIRLSANANLTVDDTVVERTLLLSAWQTSYLDVSTEVLNIETQFDSHITDAELWDIDSPRLHELNVHTVAGRFVLYHNLDVGKSQQSFALNLTGEQGASFILPIRPDSFDTDAPLSTFSIDASNLGINSFDAVELGSMQNDGVFEFTGSNAETTINQISLGETRDGFTIKLASDAGVKISSLTGTILNDNLITICSTGGGVNEITSMSQFDTFYFSNDSRDATLKITGDQHLKLGEEGAWGNSYDIGARILDASEFTGTLSARLERLEQKAGNTIDDATVIVKLGTGDANITIDGADNYDPGAGRFVFELTKSNFGDIVIGKGEGLLQAGFNAGAQLDILDFSAIYVGPVQLINVTEEGAEVRGSNNFITLLNIDTSGDDAIITHNSDTWTGSITLVGVNDATLFDASNFAFHLF